MENFPINDYRRLFLRIFQHPSYRKLPCAQRSNYTRRYSLRHPSWGTFPILTNRSDNSRCFFNTRFMGNLMCLESSILDRPPFNTLRSLSLVLWETVHQIQHLSTPTLWETYAVVNGPTMTRLPFSTPILRETCVFRCEVCYNVVSFTPPREP
jgi:hypothetical protein